MTKYRIALQTVSLGRYKHVHNIMFSSNDQKKVIKKLRLCLKDEIKKHVKETEDNKNANL